MRRSNIVPHKPRHYHRHFHERIYSYENVCCEGESCVVRIFCLLLNVPYWAS